ncbi:MAG: substrate-binding domain-containing protein [Phycisphaerales bacterium]
MQRVLRRSFLAVATGLIVAALARCGDSSPTPKPAPSAPNASSGAPAKPVASDKQYVIGYSQCNRGEPWREQMDKDIERSASEHPSIKLVMKDAQNDALTQQAHVKEFIAQRVNALIISPKDTSLTQVVADAFDAGIPVIVLDRAVEGDKYTCFIGADNRVIGAAVGKWVVEQLGGKGNVVELRGLSSSIPSADRSEPFRAAIKPTEIKIVYEADMEWLGDKAREKMQAALARSPEPKSIQLVYGANDPAAIAAYYAAKDAGREKEMMFVGVDALPHEGVEAVRKGILNATFEYPNGADIAIANALKIFEGQTVPKKVVLGTRLFTKENVDAGGAPVGQ